jgi:alpha-N-arabinofuranosidase
VFLHRKISLLAAKVAAIFLVAIAAGAIWAAASQDSPGPASVTVHLDRTLGIIDPLIYGHFTEETLTSWEGGVSSQMLVDRKFSVPEVRNPGQPWLKGTGGGWEPLQVAPNVTLVQDQVVYYSAPTSQRITNSGGSVPAGVAQSGFQMVMPQVSPDARVPYPFEFRAGEHYRARLAIKNQDLHGPVYVALGESSRNAVARHAIEVKGGEDWEVYEFELTPTAEAHDAKFIIYIDSPGTIWVDSASLVRADLDEGGFRKDVMEATRKLQPTNVRWPGGWFVSDYHWQDGIGPVDKRPARQNRAWNVVYNNDIGVDEYIAYSRAVGSEPYIVVNVGTGTPEEAAALVEYVNGSATSRWGRMRAQNGHKEPYKVRLWNIGNEEFLPTLGGTDGKTYAAHYLAFARAMRAVDPAIKIVAVGMFEIPKGAIPENSPIFPVLRYVFDWGAQFLPIAGKESDYYAIHYYDPGDTMKSGYTAEDFQRAAMVVAEDLDRKLKTAFAVMDKNGRRIPIALDEWRLNTPDNAPEGTALDVPAGVTSPAKVAALGPATSQLQAVGEAAVYNMMQRRPKDFGLVSRTILYAYAIGLFGIRRDQVVFSPAAHMLEMYATRDRCESLDAEVVSDKFDVAPKAGFAGARGAAYVDVSARRHPNGQLDVFLVNRSLKDAIPVTLSTAGGAPAGAAHVSILSADKVIAWNTYEQPNRVVVHASQAQPRDGKLELTLPPYSVVRVSW